MAKSRPLPVPAPGYDPVAAGFLDARGKLIEVAAFLDRAERGGRFSDYRVRALKSALKKLTTPGKPAQRAAAILRALSDPTATPAKKAGQPSAGAWKK